MIRFNTNNLRLLHNIAAMACLLLVGASHAHAGGSRYLFPSGIGGSRANIEWRTDSYGPTTPVDNSLKRRTLLKVYANANEYILVGSSAVGVGLADILIYNPGLVTGRIGNENVPAIPSYKASSQAGKGKITSRAQELAGPKSISGLDPTGNGFAPAYYKAPETGIYDVVFYGPAGGASSQDIGPPGDIALTNTSDFNTNQATTCAAWDVTVRPTTTSTTDILGRLFSYYLSLYTGGNGRPVFSTFYSVTLDGYKYRTSLNGLDPNGFVIYGNLQGYLDSDGVTPLYHDVLGSNGQLSTIQGGANLALPQYPVFFADPNGTTDANTVLMALGIPFAPTAPVVSNTSFVGTAGGNKSVQNTGGTFHFDSNVTGNFTIIISRDGANFDPTLTTNRLLKGNVAIAGTQTVTWDGKDNSGAFFPVGSFPAHTSVHAGEYHFPMIDAENSVNGGPILMMENASNPLGVTNAFYDDRGYRLANGNIVGTVNTVLCGLNPPTIPNSDFLLGYDSAGMQRAYGGNPGSNTNVPCTGSFGDAKGLDVWTYYPSSGPSTVVTIIPLAPKILLVKRITAVNTTNLAGYVHDPSSTDDQNANWPSPTSVYLRGATSVNNVKPGDQIEYTIYFLNAGTDTATNISLCDVLMANTTFASTFYNGLGPNDGGLPGTDQGIALALSATAVPTIPNFYLTNVQDSDRGIFYKPGAQAPAAANSASGFTMPLPGASNTNGVVCVNIVTTPATLPYATGPGVPPNSYGFIRFKVTVN